MVKYVDTYSIFNNDEPTFNSTNGSSVFDLCLIYQPRDSHHRQNLTTYVCVELFTGAPNRGHLPVLDGFGQITEKLKPKKLWVENAEWMLWSHHVETGIDEVDLNYNNSTSHWRCPLNFLFDALKKNIPRNP